MKKILFTKENTTATIEGVKTMTRRTVKPQPFSVKTFQGEYLDNYGNLLKPKYRVGEKVYIPEPYKLIQIADSILNIKVGEAEFFFNVYKKPFNAGIFDWINKRFEEQIRSKSGFCNKMFMPERLARLFIEITSVRLERLQDISDEDCLAEGAVEWLMNWAFRKAPIYECQHWVNGDDYDQSFSFCFKCCKKEVEKIKKEKGLTDDDIFVDGGWTQESDSPVYCESCDKPLQYFFVGRLEDYLDFPIKPNKRNAFLIDAADLDKKELLKLKGLPRAAFAALWESINGKGSWELNPYVWVYEYKFLK